MKICSKCGAQLADEAMMCPNCGTPQGYAPQGFAQPQAPVDDEPATMAPNFGQGFNQGQSYGQQIQNYAQQQAQQFQQPQQAPQAQQFQQPQQAPQAQQFQQPQQAPQMQQFQQPQQAPQMQQFQQPQQAPQAQQFQQPQQNPYAQQPAYGQNYAGMNQPAAEKKKSKGPLIAIIAAVVALAVAAVLVFVVIKPFDKGGKSENGSSSSSSVNARYPYASVIEDFVDGIAQKDYNRVKRTFLSPVQDYFDQVASYYGGESALMDMFISQMVTGYSGSLTASVAIKNENAYSAEEIADIEWNYSYYYDYAVTIEEAYEITVEETFYADGQSSSITENLIVIKVGGKWYVDDPF